MYLKNKKNLHQDGKKDYYYINANYWGVNAGHTAHYYVQRANEKTLILQRRNVDICV